mgnify:CR=1 FL=1
MHEIISINETSDIITMLFLTPLLYLKFKNYKILFLLVGFHNLVLKLYKSIE